MIRTINRLLARINSRYLILPAPPSRKAVEEYANVIEVNRPVGPAGARYLRKIGRLLP